MEVLKIKDGRDHLVQWDTGRQFIVEESDATEIHISNGSMNECCVINVNNDVRTADIPDSILTQYGRLTAHEFKDGHTLRTQYFEVIKKKKPQDYVYSETEKNSFQKMNEKIEDLEENKVDRTELDTYAPKNWVRNQGYLTEHQNISHLETVTDAAEKNKKIYEEIRNNSKKIEGLEKTGLEQTLGLRIENGIIYDEWEEDYK